MPTWWSTVSACPAKTCARLHWPRVIASRYSPIGHPSVRRHSSATTFWPGTTSAASGSANASSEVSDGCPGRPPGSCPGPQPRHQQRRLVPPGEHQPRAAGTWSASTDSAARYSELRSRVHVIQHQHPPAWSSTRRPTPAAARPTPPPSWSISDDRWIVPGRVGGRRSFDTRRSNAGLPRGASGRHADARWCRPCFYGPSELSSAMPVRSFEPGQARTDIRRWVVGRLTGIDTVLLDLDGTLYVGSQVVAGAPASGLARVSRIQLVRRRAQPASPTRDEINSPVRRGVAIHPIRVMPSVRWTDSMRTEGGR
jgi:hypothetical protein